MIDALVPILKHDRDDAVQLFIEVCQGGEIAFGSHPFEEFVRYASSTHYAELRGILVKALHSTSTAAVAAAARQICLAAFGDETAEADANSIRTGRSSFKTGIRTS